jgi:hypothetical protein
MNLNDYGKQKVLADTCQRIEARKIVREHRKLMKHSLGESGIDINEVHISFTGSRTGNGGMRFWFSCPVCAKRVGVLYQRSDAIGCRVCFKLDYRSHRYKGMIESNLGTSSN